MRLLAITLGILGWVFLTSPSPSFAAELLPLDWAWQPREPYLVEEATPSGGHVTGLDAELVSAAARRSGWQPQFVRTPWNETLGQIESGRRVIASGVYQTPDRDAFAYFSKPYREEVTVLVAKRSLLSAISAANCQDLFSELKRADAKISGVEGYYYGPEEAAFRNASDFLATKSDAAAFSALTGGEVDGALMDQLVAASLLWKSDFSSEFDILPMPIYHAPVHVMFSRKAFTEGEVARFDRAMSGLKEDGEYQKIVSHHLFPMLLQISTGKPWYLLLTILGVSAAAFSGAIQARIRNFSMIGAIVLAALPALGGGLLRDIIVGRYPVAVVRLPFLLPLVAVVAISVYSAFRLFGLRNRVPAISRILPFFDAASVGALSVSGVMVALEMKVEPLYLWGPILGAITAGGGGILSNVLVAESNHRNLIDAFYLEIALFWGLGFSIFLKIYAARGVYYAWEMLLAVLITIIGASLTRLSAIRGGWKGLRI